MPSAAAAMSAVTSRRGPVRGSTRGRSPRSARSRSSAAETGARSRARSGPSCSAGSRSGTEEAERPALAVPIAANAAPRLRSATTPSGSSGWATRRSRATKASRTAPPVRAPTVRDRPSRRTRRGLGRRRARTGRSTWSASWGGRAAAGPARGRGAAGACRRSPPGSRRGATRTGTSASRARRSRPAEQRADGAARAGDAGVDAEGLAALGRLDKLSIGYRVRQKRRAAKGAA
jgi:hypothetical protein